MLIFIATMLSACGIYSFSGVNLEGAETISVSNFINRSGGGPPNLGQDFTEQLRDYYQRNTSLGLQNRNADLEVEGSIVTYQVTPIAATANDQAAQNRLTIGVEVKFRNNMNDKKSFEKTFSFYSDFPQNQTLAQVENEKIEEIFEQVILDIFNNTVADW